MLIKIHANKDRRLWNKNTSLVYWVVLSSDALLEDKFTAP